MPASTLIYNEFTSKGLSEALPIASLLVLVSLVLFIIFKILQTRGEVYGS